MTLYHGSQSESVRPQFGLGSESHDFGKGLYLCAAFKAELCAGRNDLSVIVENAAVGHMTCIAQTVTGRHIRCQFKGKPLCRSD